MPEAYVYSLQLLLKLYLSQKSGLGSIEILLVFIHLTQDKDFISKNKSKGGNDGDHKHVTNIFSITPQWMTLFKLTLQITPCAFLAERISYIVLN